MLSPDQNDTETNSAMIVISKYAFMIVGMAVLALGISLTVEAGLGLASWSVFHKALENLTPLTFGQVTQAVGLVVILAGWALGVGPRLGTFLNILFVGWFIDIYRGYVLLPPDGLPLQAIFLVGGVAITGLGAGMYMSADVGAGPRDALMLALAGRSSWSVGRIRSGMELTVMVMGWALGGPVGVGTVVAALLVGPAVQYSLRLFEQLEAYPALGRVIHVPLRRKPPAKPGPATAAAND